MTRNVILTVPPFVARKISTDPSHETWAVNHDPSEETYFLVATEKEATARVDALNRAWRLGQAYKRERLDSPLKPVPLSEIQADPWASRESIERSIAEMWSALADTPHDEDYEQACTEAAVTEKRLRAQLAIKERLDKAAPHLLTAVDAVSANLHHQIAINSYYIGEERIRELFGLCMAALDIVHSPAPAGSK